MADEYLEFSTPTLTARPQVTVDAGDERYTKSLAPRHVGMIAIGGAIGTGLLLGAGGKLLTAVALYMHYWGAFQTVPQWLLARCALVVVLTINLVSVRLFGEIEFWFALIKGTAIMSFLVVGVWLLGTGHEVAGSGPGLGLVRDYGGFFALGVLPVFSVLQSVVFAYAGVEMVGITAGETREPAKVVPRAVRSVTWRIALFYVCSVLMLALLLPWNKYSATQSPFVTVLSKIGVPGVGGIMNVVVLTAAMSSLNSGFSSTGRVLRSMAAAGSAPRFTGLMNARHVPYGGILFTCAFATLGVGLNAWLPGEAFEIVVNFAALGVVTTWIMVMLCHLLFVRCTREAAGGDRLARPAIRPKGWPWVNLVTVAFLAAAVVDMGVDGGKTGQWTVAAIPLIAAVLGLGWVISRRRMPDVTR